MRKLESLEQTMTVWKAEAEGGVEDFVSERLTLELGDLGEEGVLRGVNGWDEEEMRGEVDADVRIQKNSADMGRQKKRKKTVWTDDEKDRVKLAFAAGNSDRVIAEELGKYVKAVAYLRLGFGLRRISEWTDDDLAHLEMAFAAGDSDEVIAENLSKTVDSVTRARYGLGLLRLDDWTDEDEKQLRAGFAAGDSDRVIAQRLGKKKSTIGNKRREFGMRWREASDELTDSDVELLKVAFVAGDSDQMIAKKLGKKETSVIDKRRELGLKRVAGDWTDEEDERLKVAFAAGESDQIIAAKLGRTEYAVGNARSRLGLLRIIDWTDEEKEQVKAGFAAGETDRMIAIRLGKATWAVTHVRRGFGLKKVSDWGDEGKEQIKAGVEAGETDEVIAERIGKRKAFVGEKRRGMGIKKVCVWTDEERELLKAGFAAGETDEAIAEKLGKKMHHVTNERNKLGLKNYEIDKFTDEEKEQVKAGFAAGETDEAIAEKLGKKVSSVAHVRRSLDLKLRREATDWTNEEQDQLRVLFNEGVHIKAIVEILGKRDQAVRHMLWKLGLSLRTRKENNRRDVDERETYLEQLLDDIQTGETSRAQEFDRVIKIVGAEQYGDVLELYGADKTVVYTKLGQSTIGEHLGENLLRYARGVSLATITKEDVRAVVKHVELPSVQTGIKATLQKNFWHDYGRMRVENPQVTYGECRTLFEKEMWERFGGESQIVDELLREVEEYLGNVDAQNLPEHMVSSLDPNRPFPTPIQKNAMLQLEEQRTYLNADAPRSGKSLVGIAFKESHEELRDETAVILTPGNVRATWEGYFSDEPGVGYFKPGFSPEVVMVRGPETIREIEQRILAGNKPQYVILNHERLSRNEYVEMIKMLDPKMVIIDEIHKLKNVTQGKQSQGLLEVVDAVSENDGYILALSATPLDNTLKDGAVLYRVLYPDEYRGVDLAEVQQDLEDETQFLGHRMRLSVKMQANPLSASLDMPPTQENRVPVYLTPEEQQLYGYVMSLDEVTAFQQIGLGLKVCLSPALLDVSPEIGSSKFAAIAQRISERIQQGDRKLAVFVNHFTTDVIRVNGSEHTGEEEPVDMGPLLQALALPLGAKVHVVDQNTSEEARKEAQQAINAQTDDLVLLALGGGTADVGIDLSGMDWLGIANPSWTIPKKQQHVGRGEGGKRRKSLVVDNFVTLGTLEEAIEQHARRKFTNNQKFLYGVPLSDRERLELQAAGDAVLNLEVNPELANAYLSAQQKLGRIFRATHELGEDGFREKILPYGEVYADNYQRVGRLSGQANANRVTGTILEALYAAEHPDARDIIILDAGSANKMLERHKPRNLDARIINLDIIAEHFSQEDIVSGNALVGSYADIPLPDKSVNAVTHTLTFDQTQFVRTLGNLERLAVLQEALRVATDYVVITLPGSTEIRDPDKTTAAVQPLGAVLVEDFSGLVQSDDRYQSRVITLRPVDDAARSRDIRIINDEIDNDSILGLKFRTVPGVTGDRKEIVETFTLNGREIVVNLNESDQAVLDEYEGIVDLGTELIAEFGEVKAIPPELVRDNNFMRVRVSRGRKDKNGTIPPRYHLYRGLGGNEGMVIVRG